MNYIHGETGSRLFRCWQAMKTRSRERGEECSIFSEWLDYTPFAEWARANGYSDNLVLCRTGDKGNYEPSNVRWDTQANNLTEAKAQYHTFFYEGREVEIYNLKKFCIDNNLNQVNMQRVKAGVRKSHKGYTAEAEGGVSSQI